MSKVLSYRPDIDALRAVAVLSVVVFHFNKNWLPGGFLGVDIFFVISGFLITLIIHREMSSSTFSFKTFYIRRIKRILPAFFAVLAASLALGALLFTQDDFALLAKSAAASMAFAANLYYARTLGYFEPAQEEKPLLHIWSLSVEEQYYFLFPVLLLLVAKKSWRVQFAFLFALIALSIAASFLPSLQDKYYLPHLRAFEMLFGSLTAVWMQYQQQQGYFAGRRWAAPFSTLSVIVLFGCLFVYTPGTPYFPGPAAVLPCLAAAGYLYFNHFDHALKKYFQWRAAVAVGLISYSLYLWHWPVLAFARYISGNSDLPLPLMLMLAALMTILATASYFVIEKPFKKWRGSFGRSFLQIYLVPTVFLVAASLVLLRLPFMNQYGKMGLARDYTSCHNNTDKQCIWGDRLQKPRVLVLGDSHADHYKTFFDFVGKKEHWSATMVTSDSCPYVDGYDGAIYQKSPACRAVYNYAGQHLQDYPQVILSMRWASQIEQKDKRASVAYDPDFFRKLAQTVGRLSREKEAVYLFLDNRKTQYSGLRSYQLQQKLPAFYQHFQAADALTPQANAHVKTIAQAYPNVYIIDAAKFIPQDFRIGGKPVYSDADHISPYGGEALAKIFVRHETLLRKP